MQAEINRDSEYYLWVYSVGAEADSARVRLLLKELEGKDILEVIAAGKEKFASVPSGGGGGVVVASASAGSGGAAPAAEVKEEPKKEEEKEESDDVSLLDVTSILALASPPICLERVSTFFFWIRLPVFSSHSSVKVVFSFGLVPVFPLLDTGESHVVREVSNGPGL